MYVNAKKCINILSYVDFRKLPIKRKIIDVYFLSIAEVIILFLLQYFTISYMM